MSQSITYVECGCGKRYTPAEFAKLEQKGEQKSDWSGESLALANCSGCGSTIAMPILVKP
jgi:hypothetical protein